MPQRRKIHGLQLHPPRTTAAAFGDWLLLHTATGSLTLNEGKIGPLIQAVPKVTSAPAHFWDHGARWFVVRLYGLGHLVTSCSILSENICWLFENKAGFDAVPGKSLAAEDGSRLHELEGGTEVTPSWRLKMIGS